MLKPVTAITLLVLFTISQAGNYIVFRFQQEKQRETMKRFLMSDIMKKDLVMVRAGNPGIRWEEEGKEFCLEQEIFDVVSIEKINGETYIFCLSDEKENELLKRYVKVVSTDEANSNNKPAKNSFKLKDTDIICKQYGFNLSGPALPVKHIHHLCTDLISTLHPVTVPPPRGFL